MVSFVDLYRLSFPYIPDDCLSIIPSTHSYTGVERMHIKNKCLGTCNLNLWPCIREWREYYSLQFCNGNNFATHSAILFDFFLLRLASPFQFHLITIFNTCSLTAYSLRKYELLHSFLTSDMMNSMPVMSCQRQSSHICT